MQARTTNTTLLFLTLALARAAGAAPTKGSKLVLPPGAPPMITITPTAPAYQSAEIRLSKFINALQADRRTDAVQLFSSKVTAPERQAFMDRRWLVKSTAKDTNFEKVLFLRDLVIRSTRVYSNGVELAVGPRTKLKPNEKRLTGFVPVRMRKERGQWWVETHPSTAKLRVKSAPKK